MKVRHPKGRLQETTVATKEPNPFGQADPLRAAPSAGGLPQTFGPRQFMNLASQCSFTGAMSEFLSSGRRGVGEIRSRLVYCSGQPQLNRRVCEALSASRNRDEEDYSVGGLRSKVKYIGSQEIEAAANAGSPIRALPRAEQHSQRRQSCKPQHYACPPLRAPHHMGPNPSFEGTATGGRRLRALRRPVAPVSAPQLKR